MWLKSLPGSVTRRQSEQRGRAADTEFTAYAALHGMENTPECSKHGRMSAVLDQRQTNKQTERQYR